MNLILQLLEYLGTAVFAYNGAKKYLNNYQSDKKYYKYLYLLGCVLLGIITAVGGGTIRDSLNRKTHFWLEDPLYIYIAIIFGIIAVL